MKRTALVRRTPLRRKKPMRRAYKKTAYARRPRDLALMAWVRRQPCAVRTSIKETFGRDAAEALLELHPCTGRVQADHAGKRGLGQKAPDGTCVPLCRKHHGERTDYRGYFGHWKAKEMRAWCDRMIDRYQKEYRDGR